MTHRVTRTIDAHYSPDDGGWYLQNYETGTVSRDLYLTLEDARGAFEDREVRWER